MDYIQTICILAAFGLGWFVGFRGGFNYSIDKIEEERARR